MNGDREWTCTCVNEISAARQICTLSSSRLASLVLPFRPCALPFVFAVQKRVGRTKRRRISRCKGHHKLSRACERSRHQTCSVAGAPPCQQSLMPTTSPLRIRRNVFWKSTDIFCDQVSWISAAERFPSLARLGGAQHCKRHTLGSDHIPSTSRMPSTRRHLTRACHTKETDLCE